MRTVLMKLHLFVALVASLFVVTLGATGAIMAFEDELDKILHPSLFSVQVSPGAPLPIDSLTAIVRRAYPGEAVGMVQVPSAADESYIVATSERAVFVNGYSGVILGMRDGPTFFDYVHQLHIRLLFGGGKTIVGIAGIAMLFLVLSGIFLWWKHKRLTMRWDSNLFKKMFDLHAVTGIYSAVFLLLLSISGVALAYDGTVLSWLSSMTGTQPIRRSMPSTPVEGRASIRPERALDIARGTLPGALPHIVQLPSKPKDSYNVMMRFPEDRTPGGRSWVSIDQYSGQVLVSQNSRTAPIPTRTMIANRAIHTGDMFGMFSKIVMSLSSILVVVQAVSGIVMWLKRPKSSGRNSAAAAFSGT